MAKGHTLRDMLTTPFGELSTLDLENPETQQRVLFYDKHQVLEGIVAETTSIRCLMGRCLRRNTFNALLWYLSWGRGVEATGAWFLC